MKTLSEDVLLIEETLNNSKQALTEKGVEVDETFKLSEVDEKIREISVGSKIHYAAECTDNGSLYQGITFPNSYPTNIVFTDEKAPDGVEVVDWSRDGDNSVVKWLDNDTDTLYISSQEEGAKIVLPSTTGNMFNSCRNLTPIDVSHFDTSSVQNMHYMFSNCDQLIEFDLTNFNTSKVTDMGGKFNSCDSLTTLDLSSFDVSELTNTKDMFADEKVLTTIYATEWATEATNVTNVSNSAGMFRASAKLPNYDKSNVDLSMAKWRENGGYFIKPETFEDSMSNIKTALQEKSVEIEEPFVLSDVDDKIKEIKGEELSAYITTIYPGYSNGGYSELDGQTVRPWVDIENPEKISGYALLLFRNGQGNSFPVPYLEEFSGSTTTIYFDSVENGWDTHNYIEVHLFDYKFEKTSTTWSSSFCQPYDG